MRSILIVPILIVILAGALFGALNGSLVPIDLYFARFHAPLGATLLCAVLSGWLLGGLVAWIGQLPLRRQLRELRARDAHATRLAERTTDDA